MTQLMHPITASHPLSLAPLPLPNQGRQTLTRATNDAEAVSGWLAMHRHPETTFSAYRKDAERLLMWCQWRGIGLANLLIEDALAYKAFLRNPLPLAQWCLQPEPRWLADGAPNPAWRDVKRVPRTLPTGAPNPAWRPFVSALSESAARHAETVLFGLFEFLVAVGWLAGNVWRVAKVRSAAPAAEVERYLEQHVWQQLLEGIEAMPRETSRDVAQYQRDRFVVRWLYLTGLRRAEFAQARASHIRLKRGKWWLAVQGKGGKLGEIPLPADAVEALRQYRVSLGQTPWPEPGETGPLLCDIHGARPMTASGLHGLVKVIFARAAEAALVAGDLNAAETLRQASAHWLRHTSASHQLSSGVALASVRDNLRHGSISTTSGYIHTDRDQRHQETEKHRA